jgi:hypothetical protein
MVTSRNLWKVGKKKSTKLLKQFLSGKADILAKKMNTNAEKVL